MRTSEAPFFSINPAISLHLSAQKRNISLSVFTKKKKETKERKTKLEATPSVPQEGRNKPNKRKKKREY